jgi:two-component system response regulator DegU
MRKISILVVDDHPFFRQGLRDVLEAEPDLRIVGEACDGEEALRLAQELSPDVAVMDVNLPTLNGIQVTRKLRTEKPSVNVVILTAYDDEEQVFHAIRAGASAYYPKDVTPDKLITAIRQVNQGHYVIGELVMNEAQLATWLLKETQRFGVASGDLGEEPFNPLSRREMEILQFITYGLSNKEIARRLGISHQTVKNHITSILHKLGVADRTQAAVYTLRRGWVRLQDTQPQSDTPKP